MAVLLPFNSSTTLTFHELCEVTQLEPKDLARHVQQLVDIKLISTTAGNIVQMATVEVSTCHTATSTCSSLLLICFIKVINDSHLKREQ